MEAHITKGRILRPNLEGDWRFRVIPYGWLPDQLQLTTEANGTTTTTDLWTSDILDNIKAVGMITAQVRKGSFGAYHDVIYMNLHFDKNKGPLNLKLKEEVFILSFGTSYELGRWKLGGGPEAPTVLVEPTFGGRASIMQTKINFTPGPRKTVNIDTVAPVLGLRTFWNLTERWNFLISGDYGGFDVGYTRETWSGMSALGYRFRMFGVASNVVAGYRAMGLDVTKGAVKLDMMIKGPIVGLAFDF